MYENIAKAALTYEEQAQNYSIFSDLMKKGVKLKDLLEKAEKPTDPELFAVMERSVKDDKTVCEAKAALCEAKEEALCRLCAQDDGYISARMRYEEAVSKAYAEAQK
jgi:hypothetical protein